MKKNLTQANPTNIYLFDFDGTIYDGNSAIDFYIFTLEKFPRLLKYFPLQVWHLVLFIFQLESRDDFKGHFFIFIKGIVDIEKHVDLFWRRSIKKIYPWYIKRDKTYDVIISASPTFYLSKMAEILNINMLIATEISEISGKLITKNCYGQEKVKRLNRLIPNANVLEAYSDSMSDLPILMLSKSAYIVKNGKIRPLLW